MKQAKEPFPMLGDLLEPLPGYLCADTTPRSSLVTYKETAQRFVFHEVKKYPDELRGLLCDTSSDLSSRLQQQFAQLVGELQDVQLGPNLELKDGQALKEPQLSWLANVEVVLVRQQGPGSRAYNPNVQLQAIVPTKDFDKYDVVGLYLVRIHLVYVCTRACQGAQPNPACWVLGYGSVFKRFHGRSALQLVC
jgi:hypothetical protein